MISIDLEGDWRAMVSWADADASAQASRLLQVYEASEAQQSQPAARGDGAAGDDDAALLADADDGDDDDEWLSQSFYAFQRRTSAHPEQALRYNRAPASEPLWAGKQGRPPADSPPHCARCGAPRSFEFQLMPQMLCAIEAASPDPSEPVAAMEAGASADAAALADALDWGVVAVYTCSATCATDAQPDGCAYADEWCWHQAL